MRGGHEVCAHAATSQETRDEDLSQHEWLHDGGTLSSAMAAVQEGVYIQGTQRLPHIRCFIDLFEREDAERRPTATK